MKKLLYELGQRISGLFQSATGSFKRHNRQYEDVDALERERKSGLHNLKEDLVNGPELRIKDLLSQHPGPKMAIDIGSGTGWSAAALSSQLDEIIAIEPSKAAVDIARELYPRSSYPNITWVTGFAETEIPKLQIPNPALFFTGCVLSHIRDKEVAAICEAVTKAAPAGSLLSFAECWGEKSWHQLMWHVRTREWWQQQLPGWRLDFHGPLVPEKDDYKGTYHKGFWGVKER